MRAFNLLNSIVIDDTAFNGLLGHERLVDGQQLHRLVDQLMSGALSLKLHWEISIHTSELSRGEVCLRLSDIMSIPTSYLSLMHLHLVLSQRTARVECTIGLRLGVEHGLDLIETLLMRLELIVHLPYLLLFLIDNRCLLIVLPFKSFLCHAHNLTLLDCPLPLLIKHPSELNHLVLLDGRLVL